MKVLNIHRRIISQSLKEILPVLLSLATERDRIWPHENWPRMKLDKGLQPGSTGGHGPIRYVVEQMDEAGTVWFRFLSPEGFDGGHGFALKAIGPGKTELKHTIDMEVRGFALLKWSLAIRWLHDALVEDAFDKLESQFGQLGKRSAWSAWVKILRFLIAGRKGLRKS